MWGRGLYFAENSNYSDMYAYEFTNGDKGIFLAKVNLGSAIELEFDEVKTRKLIEPPKPHDSVKGHTQNSDVYIVYANKKAYPQFFIRYNLEAKIVQPKPVV